jgi:hypothetical protein
VFNNFVLKCQYFGLKHQYIRLVSGLDVRSGAEYSGGSAKNSPREVTLCQLTQKLN